MSNLEKARSNHEDVELIEESASQLLLHQSQRRVDTRVDHGIDFLCRELMSRSSSLLEIHNGTDTRLSSEHHTEGTERSTDIWHRFYSSIKHAKEYARHNSEQSNVPENLDIDYWSQVALHYCREVSAGFPPAEANGRFVDMDLVHQKFLNMKRMRDHLVKSFVQARWAKHISKIQKEPDLSNFQEFSERESLKFREPDYVTWLQNFHMFESIPRHLKYKQTEYSEYITACADYLRGFVSRHRPLMDIVSSLTDRTANFQERWSKREVAGWATLTHEMQLFAPETDRIFASEGTLNAHKNSKDFAKNKQIFGHLTPDERNMVLSRSEETDMKIAALEDEICFLHDLLRPIFEDTIDHVTRKQARSAREVEEELEAIQRGELPAAGSRFDDADSAASSSGGEEVDLNDRAIYNPLHLPLGFDGKPIPYWMYKLHGLGHEFKCEICGNTSYWGRRAFDKHFSEWRHINGLKALHIPNSNHFHGVTGIEDAIRLHEKMRRESVSTIFNAEREMECEDASGNVMSYRTYQDLMRQGML